MSVIGPSVVSAGMASEPDRLLMARAARVFFAGGAILCVLGIALPHSPHSNIAGFWAIGALTATVAALISIRPARLPIWCFQAAMILGTLLVALAIYFSGERHGALATDDEMLFLWITLFSAYFFSRTAAAIQVSLIATAYLTVLVLTEAGNIGWTRWTVTVTMLAVSALLVSRLRHRVDELIRKLREAARTDALTGLLNRGGFEQVLEAEVSRARRTERPVCLLVGDLDRFKHLNDLLGHPAGDAALRRVASILDSGTRAMDAVARIGGEEFAVIAPEENAATGHELAERLRRDIERSFANEAFPLTISFGTVAFPGAGDSPPALIGAADRALYAAKDAGRNRCIAGAAEVLTRLGRASAPTR